MTTSLLNFAYIIVAHIVPGFCRSTRCVGLSSTFVCKSSELLVIEKFAFYDWPGCSPHDMCGLTYFYEYPVCNIPGNCRVDFRPTPQQCYQDSKSRVLVTYRCIKVTFHNLCQEKTVESIFNTSKLFLSTPEYPRLSTFTTAGSCSCTVHGSSIVNIIVMHLRMDTAFNDQSSKFVIRDDRGRVIYNKISNEGSDGRLELNYEAVQTPVSSPATITFNHQSTPSRLLIYIHGADLTLRCNTPQTTSFEFTTFSSGPTAFVVPVDSTLQSTKITQLALRTTTSSVERQPGRTGTNGISIPILIGSIVGGILLLALAIIVAACSVKRRKKPSNKTDTTIDDDNDVEPPSRGVRAEKAQRDMPTLVSDRENNSPPEHNRDNSYPCSKVRSTSKGSKSSGNDDGRWTKGVGRSKILYCLPGTNTPNQSTSSHVSNEIIIMENVDYVSGDNVAYDTIGPDGIAVASEKSSILSFPIISQPSIPTIPESSGQVEILENELYVPLEKSLELQESRRNDELFPEVPSSDVDSLGNDLFISQERPAQPTTSSALTTDTKHSDTAGVEILEKE